MTLAEQRTLMRSGQMYNDLTDELVQARARTVLLTNEYNASFSRPAGEREQILGSLLGGLGRGVHFEPTLRCEFGFNVVIGDNFYANFDCVLLDGGGITVGDNVLFGPRVSVYTSNHAFDAEERVRGGCYAKPVSIGSNTWVGGGVTINPGVAVGADVIIGSGSVVTRSIPDGMLAAGVPCRVLRPLTDADKTGFTP